jgi:hypothetical protein
MLAREEVAGPILELAIGHGLVDDLLRQSLTQSDVLDLVNRLLLTEAIDSSQAISLINLVMAEPANVLPAE